MILGCFERNKLLSDLWDNMNFFRRKWQGVKNYSNLLSMEEYESRLCVETIVPMGSLP